MNKILSFFNALTKNPVWVFKNLFLSLTNDPNKGFSYKKLSACVFLLLILMLHICLWKYQLAQSNFSLFITVLATDIGTFSALIGISTLHQMNLQKNNDKEGGEIITDIKN